MLHRLVVVAVVGFWAVMTASLVRRWLLEVKPESIPGTYRSVLTADRQNYQSRMGIYLPGVREKMGYTETVFLYSEDGKYRISNATRLRAPVPGFLEKLSAFALDMVVVVGKGYALERFSMVLHSPVIAAECRGEVVDEELVLRAMVHGEAEQVHKLPLPRGGLVATGLSPLLALPPLRVGLRWWVIVLNPLTLEPTEVELEVTGREPLQWAGRSWDTHVVEIRSGYLRAQAWVSDNGEVLKEKTLFGLTLVKEQVIADTPPPPPAAPCTDGPAQDR